MHCTIKTFLTVLLTLFVVSTVNAQEAGLDAQINKDNVADLEKSYSPYVNKAYPQKAVEREEEPPQYMVE